MSAPMNDRLRATGEALDAMMTTEQALAYRPPPQAAAPAPQEPTFPPLEGCEDSQPPMGRPQKGKAAADEPVEDFDNHRNAPRPDPACLYGLVGEIAKTGSDTTEANPYAIAAAAIAYLGCAVGRGPYMPVGNTWHHPRLFMLHVGRSGEGRKGDAVSLTKRIAHRVAELSQDHAPKVHSGGLSSREGLVFMIHDGYKDGKDEVPPILDKRLLVVESEFVNVLHQGKRDGNTLSAALRDCWDGVSLKPATKTNRLWASNPHIGMVAAITGGELLACMASRDLSNGFANRFLPYWAERTRLLPFPKATPVEEVDRLARRVLEVLEFCQASRWVEHDTLRVELSKDASQCWAALYRGELNDRSHGERINVLIERRAPMLLRLAMLFALTDCTNIVQVRHIDAALAWVRYSVESVKFIFGSAADEAEVAEVNDTARKIEDFIEQHGRVTRWQISSECFKGHASKDRLDAALDELLTTNPPRIVVKEERVGKGRPTKFYELLAKKAKYAKNEHPCGFASDFGPCEESEVSPIGEVSPPGLTSQLRILRKDEKSVESRASIDSSLTSHTSQPDLESEEIPESTNPASTPKEVL